MDVAIAGAGIGGAVLALDLGRRGWRTTILERDAAPPPMIRPEVLWDATVRALDRFGLGDTIRQQSTVRLYGGEFHRGAARAVVISAADLDAAGTALWSTDPAATRALILDAALATGRATVVRPFKVTGILKDGRRAAGVRGERPDGRTEEVAARVVIGDDGVRSTVREALGVGIDLKLFPLEFVTTPIDWPPDLTPDRARAWIGGASGGRPAGAVHDPAVPAAAFVPWPGGRGVCLIPLPHADADRLFGAGPERFWASLAGVTPMAPWLRERVAFPADFARVRRLYGHAARYTAAGAAVMGDAAHPMSPVGGQGANAAIWDAMALAEVLDAALRAGDVSRERLAPYERLRRRANRRSLSFTRRAAVAFRVARHLPGVVALAPLAIGLLARSPWPRRALIRYASTAFVTR
jgi:monooxygenase